MLEQELVLHVWAVVLTKSDVIVVTAAGVQDLLGLLEPLRSRDLLKRADWY